MGIGVACCFAGLRDAMQVVFVSDKRDLLSKLVSFNVWLRLAHRLLRRPLNCAALLARRSDGTAAVEFAIIGPMLIAIMVPVIDLGLGFYQKMQVDDAAQAGAQYAMAHGWNSTAIQNAVSAATSLSAITATPAPVQSCGCPTGSSVAAAACGTRCDNGQVTGTYVTVSAQAVYTTLVPYPGIGPSITLNARSMARIQ